jgi:hypothetical protein
MIVDSLTKTGIIISLLVLVLVIGALVYSHYTMKKNLKILARNSILMDADEEMKELCKKIMAINPDACPILDGDASKLIKADPDRLKALLKEHLRTLEQAA